MATLYGVNADYNLVDVPRTMIPHGEAGGRVRLLYDTFTSTAAPSSGDIIKMGAPIPKGARVIDAMLKHTDFGNTAECKFGWAASSDAAEAADDDGFMLSVDLNAAANVVWSSDNLAAPAGIGKQFTAEVQPQVELSASATANGTIQSFILYVLD